MSSESLHQVYRNNKTGAYVLAKPSYQNFYLRPLFGDDSLPAISIADFPVLYTQSSLTDQILLEKATTFLGPDPDYTKCLTLLHSGLYIQYLRGVFKFPDLKGYFAYSTVEQIIDIVSAALNYGIHYIYKEPKAGSLLLLEWLLHPSEETYVKAFPSYVNGSRPTFSISQDEISLFRVYFNFTDGHSLNILNAAIPASAWSEELCSEFTIPVPSGRLAIANDLRAFFPTEPISIDVHAKPEFFPDSYINHPCLQTQSPHITCNTALGKRAFSFFAAAHGRGEIFTGNSSTLWLKHKLTNTILAVRSNELSDLSREHPELNASFEEIGTPNSDLWWQHFADSKYLKDTKAYYLWDERDIQRCGVQPVSFDEWHDKHKDLLTVDLPPNTNAVQVLAGNKSIIWIDPTTNIPIQTRAILTPVQR